jgi:hypothetical protein
VGRDQIFLPPSCVVVDSFTVRTAMSSSSSGGEHLVVVFDVNARAWHSAAASAQRSSSSSSSSSSSRSEGKHLSFDGCVDALVSFIHAYLLLHKDNRIAVVASSPSGSEYVWPMRGSPASFDVNHAVELGEVTSVVAKALHAVHQTDTECEANASERGGSSGRTQLKEGEVGGTLLSGGMSLAMLHLQRMAQQHPAELVS